MYALN